MTGREEERIGDEEERTGKWNIKKKCSLIDNNTSSDHIEHGNHTHH